MTICHHSPNINSGVRPSHLLKKVSVWRRAGAIARLLRPGLVNFSKNLGVQNKGGQLCVFLIYLIVVVINILNFLGI